MEQSKRSEVIGDESINLEILINESLKNNQRLLNYWNNMESKGQWFIYSCVECLVMDNFDKEYTLNELLEFDEEILMEQLDVVLNRFLYIVTLEGISIEEDCKGVIYKYIGGQRPQSYLYSNSLNIFYFVALIVSIMYNIEIKEEI